MSDASIPPKQCKCGREFPATSEYFSVDKRNKDGLGASCRLCERERSVIKMRKYRALNPEKARDEARAYRAKNRLRLRENESRRRLENPERRLTYHREWRKRNPQKTSEYSARYKQKHPEKVKENQRNYRQNHPEKNRLKSHNHRARVAELPFDFTDTDWQRAVDYFHGCCVVCGRQGKDLLGTHILAIEHWIALEDKRPDNPGTVPTNIVPMCHGQNGCNNSKHNYDPIDWLHHKFGRYKAKKIIERVETYFEWIRIQDETAE